MSRAFSILTLLSLRILLLSFAYNRRCGFSVYETEQSCFTQKFGVYEIEYSWFAQKFPVRQCEPWSRSYITQQSKLLRGVWLLIRFRTWLGNYLSFDEFKQTWSFSFYVRKTKQSATYVHYVWFSQLLIFEILQMPICGVLAVVWKTRSKNYFSPTAQPICQILQYERFISFGNVRGH